MDIRINDNSIRQAKTDKLFLIYPSTKHIILFFSVLLFSTCLSAQKTYQKTHFDNGVLKAEGWIKNNQKFGYWKFYYENGNIKKEGQFLDNKETKYWYFYQKDDAKKNEGHFIDGKKQKWWIFYNENKKINYKCQFKDNQKNGYCLIYKDKKMVKAEKYKAGKKIKEWTDLKSFKKENNLLDLQ